MVLVNGPGRRPSEDCCVWVRVRVAHVFAQSGARGEAAGGGQRGAGGLALAARAPALVLQPVPAQAEAVRVQDPAAQLPAPAGLQVHGDG